MFLYLGQTLSLFGSVLTSFVIIFYLTLETGSALVLAFTVLLITVPQIFITPLAGVFVDRLNRKFILGLADFLQAFATLGLIYTFIFEATNFYLIIILLGIKGIFQSFHQPTFSAIIPSLIPKDKLMQNNSIMSLGNASVEMMAPILAGLLIAFDLPIYQLLWIDVITFLIAVFILFFIKIPNVNKYKEEDKKPDSTFISEFKEGISYLNRGKGFIPLLFSFAFINFTFAPLSVLIPLLVLIYHGGTAIDFALVTILLQGGIIAVSILLASKLKIKRTVMGFLFGIVGMYIAVLFIGLAPQGSLWVLFLSFFAIGVFLAIAQISAQTIWHKAVPLQLQGRVASVRMTISTIISPIGILIAGLFAEEIGASSLMIYFAVLGLIMLFFLFFFTSIREVENQELNSQTKVDLDGNDSPKSLIGD